MAFSSQCQSFFFLVLIVFASSSFQTHARESKFFSKVSRPEPTTPNPKQETETKALSPSASPTKEANTVQGYGLFGQEGKETYQYPPTTTNPTKSAPRKFTYVQSNGVSKEYEMPYKNNNGYHYRAREKQGMSDTRFLENGRYFYDVENEREVGNNGKLIENKDGHESYYGNNYENGNHYPKERYGAGEKRGMSDTRFLENGRYYYDIEAEKKNNGNAYSNKVEFYNNNNNNNNYENEEEEEEEEEEKYEKEGYGRGEKQGMSDTRFLEDGRYFYDINAEQNHNYNRYGNSVEQYNNNNNNNNENYKKASYEPEKFSYEKESGKYIGSGNGYDFRSTPNKFPNYEFDSMEEYEKYEQNRRHQDVYEP